MSAKPETPIIRQLSLPDNRLLAYLLDDSPQDAPVVLLSNPLCTNIAVWDHIVPVLNHAGLRTLRYDQPGHGDSSAPADLTTTTFDSMVEDVAYLLDALGIPKLWAWIGVSMGAAAGIFFATVGGAVEEAVCVVGEKDANLPRTMEDMRGQIEEGFREAGKAGKVELVVVPDAGHVCFVDGLEEFVRLIPRFIQAEKK
uniref:AB hydrolase-1 domain-containing protein n=1 Tax=Bionectria ochroleuca TaxID=29856 RepID=A0A0B7KB59_BIOOC